MANRLMAGTLADWLLEQDASGASVETIMKKLYGDFDIDVSRTTITGWLRSLKAAS